MLFQLALWLRELWDSMFLVVSPRRIFVADSTDEEGTVLSHFVFTSRGPIVSLTPEGGVEIYPRLEDLEGVINPSSLNLERDWERIRVLREESDEVIAEGVLSPDGRCVLEVGGRVLVIGLVEVLRKYTVPGFARVCRSDGSPIREQ